MQGFRLIRCGYRREIAGLKHPPVQSFLKYDTPILIQEQEDIDVSNVERVVSQLGADVIRVMTPHEIVSPVPVGIITSHDRQSRLLIVQFILETVNVLACIVTFQPRETVQQSKAGSCYPISCPAWDKLQEQLWVASAAPLPAPAVN